MEGDAPLGPQSEAGIGVRRTAPIARRNLLNAATRGLLMALVAFSTLALLEGPRLAFGAAALGFGLFATALAYLEVWAERAGPFTVGGFLGLATGASLLAGAGLLFLAAQLHYTEGLLSGVTQDQALGLALRSIKLWHPGLLLYLTLNLGLASALRIAFGRDLGMGQLFELGRGAAVLLLALSLPLWAPLGITLFTAWVADGFEDRVSRVLRPKE